MSDTVVDDGQVSTGAVLNNGDTQIVESTHHDLATGGKAYGTIINQGGVQKLDYGTSDHAVINSMGEQDVLVGSLATNAVLSGTNDPNSGYYLSNDAHQNVTGGTATGTIIDSGGNQSVSGTAQAGGIASGTIINDRGFQFVNAYGSAGGTIVHSGGQQEVFGAAGGPASVTDTTIETGGTQLLAQGGTEKGDILQVGGKIVIFGGFGNDPFSATTSFDQATGTLTVSSGSTSYNLNLVGDYRGKTFSVYAPGLSDSVGVELLCFCRGTRIRTPAGDVPVERLRVDDEVVTVSGRRCPIRWIGATAAIVNERNRPVIVRAGAFGDASPYRDVRVTRSHSFLFGDVLIPIEQLVNDTTIQFDHSTRAVELFHVELDRHDVLLAEGAPAESFRDIGNRIGFAQLDGSARSSAGAMPTYAPLVYTGPIVERTRRRLAERVGTAPAESLSTGQSPIVRGSELVRSAIS